MKQLVVRAIPVTLFLLLTAAFFNTLSAQTTQPTKRQPKVTKEFVTDLDNATIDIKRGTILMNLYVQKTERSPWTQIDLNAKDPNSKTQTVPQPADANSTNDASISQPNTYQIKLVVTMDADDAAVVVFN